MRAEPGTYALILRNSSATRLHIGALGRIDPEPGYYIYVGSAFGPGGVRARVARHLRRTKACHWHIDYLSGLCSPIAVWYSHGGERLEHEWAQALCDMSAMSAVKGFGCTDCRCHSHLFQTPTTPDVARFSAAATGRIEVWSCPDAAEDASSHEHRN
ncbi:MAG: DUF123 domain-containing protein [Gammaproteobacteria bacterium]|nr:DUF123 domain-containing protein [Gammaproteobacteria bacterium]